MHIDWKGGGDWGFVTAAIFFSQNGRTCGEAKGIVRYLSTTPFTLTSTHRSSSEQNPQGERMLKCLRETFMHKRRKQSQVLPFRDLTEIGRLLKFA